MHTHLQENRERYSEELGAINKIVIFFKTELTATTFNAAFMILCRKQKS